MKKITQCLIVSLAFITFIPTQANAVSERSPGTPVSTAPAEAVAARDLLNRLDEIQAMDKSKLTSSDKKQLRKEVRTIKQNLRAVGGGVYLSVGAIIIIILLLILLL